MKAIYPTLAALVVISGCTSPQQKENQAYVDQLSPCDKIEALVGAYDNQFEGLKLGRIQSKYMDSWQSRYNLIGESCQISALNDKTMNYHCQESYKDKTQALSIHNKAVEFTRQCLGENWFEKQKESGNSLRTTFVLDESAPVVSIHTGKSLSKRTPWMTSYEVGTSVK
ncbi:hypothetical protein MHM89_04765 [Pseudoalteromonas sp. CNC9-20]|uniref:hypothetical protein n=1 Tax=Pseudoalteromonas sp. CNC9-20 TaxID=2917750 RepID=UPI001EF72DF9|nr:hypothetical protein [Pseudoalteromonas sp. CNC9-20]MCG7569234.1 hypothetical protein [Pseudoalteromonas sp. CNC9-20]